MHNNRYWLALLVFVTVVTVFFIGRAGLDLYRYYSYARETVAQRVEWSFVEADGGFYPVATFHFEAEGSVYKVTEVLLKRWQRNEWSVSKQLEEFEKFSWKVWYAPKDPNFATVDRSYPWRRVVYAGVLLALTVYFVGLGLYVGGLNK